MLCILLQLTDELIIHRIRQKRVKKFAIFSIELGVEHTQMESFVKRQIIAIDFALLLIIIRATTFIHLITL